METENGVELGVAEEDLPQEAQVEDLMTWRTNAHLLYDLFVRCDLEWPALSAAWLPDEADEPCRLAIGMHTDGSAAPEVVVAELCCGVSEECLKQDDWRRWSVPGFREVESLGCEVTSDGAAGESAGGPLREVARFAHPTEVNRLLPCPRRGQLLATKTAAGSVLLFDYKAPRSAGVVAPDAEFRPSDGAGADGFALDWGTTPSGQLLLASGSNDGRLCVWQVENAPRASAGACLLEVPSAHSGALCGLGFAKSTSPPGGGATLATVGEDGRLLVWDVRAGTSPVATKRIAGDEVLSVAWSYQPDNLIATCGKERVVDIWDFRASIVRAPVHRLEGHDGDVVVVHWAPFRAGLLASCSQDGRLNIWDLEAEAPAEDSLEGNAKELIFSHAGHTAGVSDFSWNSTDEFLLCSVGEDNALHIWQPNADVYLEGGDEAGGGGAGDAGASGEGAEGAAVGQGAAAGAPAEVEAGAERGGEVGAGSTEGGSAGGDEAAGPPAAKRPRPGEDAGA